MAFALREGRADDKIQQKNMIFLTDIIEHTALATCESGHAASKHMLHEAAFLFSMSFIVFSIVVGGVVYLSCLWLSFAHHIGGSKPEHP